MSNAIVFEPLFPGAKTPHRATEHSAGYDLYVYLKGRSVTFRDEHGTRLTADLANDDAASIDVQPGTTALLPLGFKAQLPIGVEAQIRMRSSWALSKGLILPNAPGTIDADYPDEWMVMVRSITQHPATVRHGDRVAQAVLNRYEVIPWVEGPVGVSSDRQGGFGSTG